MRFLHTCSAALVALFFTAGAVAQPAPSDTLLTLSGLLGAALDANPVLRAVRLDAEAMATRPAQVSALPDPSVMVGYRPLAVSGLDGAVPSELMVEQMIPYPGKLALQREAATLGARAARVDVDAMALDIALDVHDAYIELYRIQEQDRLIAGFLDQLAAFEEASAVRYEVGQGPQQAILKAQLERNALARQRLELAAARREQIERLARLTNRPDLAAHAGGLVLTPPVPDAALESTLASALQHRPEIEALRLRQEQAEAEIDLARLAYRPDFMVSAGLMDMMGMDGSVRPLQNLADRFAIQAGIVVPLRRAPRDAAVEESRLRRRQLDAELEALETAIATEINALQARMTEDARAMALYESTLIPQAETTLESTLSAYTTGQTDFLDLLDAERMLFDLRMSYAETHARYLQTRALLGRTLGLPPALLAAAAASHASPARQD